MLTQAVIYLMHLVGELVSLPYITGPVYLHAALASQRNPARDQIGASNMHIHPNMVKLRQLCSKQYKLDLASRRPSKPFPTLGGTR
jgi:hypothetical protein